MIWLAGNNIRWGYILRYVKSIFDFKFKIICHRNESNHHGRTILPPATNQTLRWDPIWECGLSKKRKARNTMIFLTTFVKLFTFEMLKSFPNSRENRAPKTTILAYNSFFLNCHRFFLIRMRQLYWQKKIWWT